jgi:tetratricopeptide (TPR) repeat protein
MYTTFLAALLLLGAPDDGLARRKAQEHYKTGLQAMSSERYAAAVESFRQAVALDPLLAMAYYNMGQSHMALKQYGEAVVAYNDTKTAFTRVGSIGARESMERDRDRRDEITELRDTVRNVSTGVIKTAQPAQMIIKLEERIRLLESLDSRGKETLRIPAEVHLALGSAYFRQNKFAEAEQAYGEAIRENNRLGAAHNNMAVIYMLTGRFKDAHQSIKSAEMAGFAVPPQLKTDLAKREAGR